LMRFKQHCQAVYGTFSTEVSLKWLTETNHKTKWEGSDSGVETYDKMFIPLEMNSWGRAQAYGRRDQIPDGHYGQDYIQIWYCYYQPTVIYQQLEEGEDGPEPWWFLDEASVGVDWNGSPKLKRPGVWNVDITIMDDAGDYVVKWPNKPTTNCPRYGLRP